MATEISFSNRDWKGLLNTKGAYNFTGNVDTSSPWVELDVGGLSNQAVLKLITTGNATSPASFGSNPVDKILFLEVKQVPRGGTSSSSGATAKYPLIKWQPSQTSTVREIVTPIETYLNTSGRVDGNIFIRIVPESGTFTSLDMCVYALRNNSSLIFSPIALFTTTNNLYANTGSGSANSVEEIASSTAGYVEYKFSKYGYFGDLRNNTIVGLNDTPSIGNITPKYYWEQNTFTQCRVVHNGSVIASGISCVEGDTLRVNRGADGTITYLKNGVIEATGGTIDTSAMKAKFTFTAIYARALGVRMSIGAGAISPDFENLANVTEF